MQEMDPESSWSMLNSPLLRGCDLTKLDQFTLYLLTNDAVLVVNQDSLGKQASRITADNGAEVWARPLADGTKAIALFNRTPFARTVIADFKTCNIKATNQSETCGNKKIWVNSPPNTQHKSKATVRFF